MRRSKVWLSGIIFGAVAAGAAEPELDPEQLRGSAAGYYAVSLDPSQSFHIERGQIQRDRLSVELGEGTLILARPILGRVTGACFLGRTRIGYPPAHPADRASLKYRSGSEALDSEADALFLRFTDSTAQELATGRSPVAAPQALEECSKVFAARNAVVSQYEEDTIRVPINLELDLAESVLSPARRQESFLLEAEIPKHGWITYLQRPWRLPEVALLRIRRPGPHGRLFDVEQWVAGKRSDASLDAGLEMPAADILDNRMEVVIPDRSSFTIDAWITWQSTLPVRSARFALVNSIWGTTWDDTFGKPVQVDSVSGEDGTSLPFIHMRHELLVRLPAVVHTGEIHRLRVRATEKTIWQITPESYGLLNTYPWFPQEPSYLGGFYTFDWTVKVLQPLHAVGSGFTVRSWVEQGTKLNCVQMKSETPLTFPSLIFGEMRQTHAEHRPRSGDRPLNIRVHWIPQIRLSSTSTRSESLPATYTFSVPAGKPKHIAAEAASIVDFYENILGPYPSGELDIAQMGPGLWFAQAPPGLVQLTSEYFLSQGLIGSFTDDPRIMDFIKTVLAHEIAHHYWGDVVSWKSEEDQWLSESLAEYSSGLYFQAAEGEKSFRQMLKSWRQDTERWESAIPIAHANRTSGEDGGSERRALLYSKGPLVIHMLRAMLGADKFVATLKKVLSDNKGRAIETADFQRAAEAVSGQSLGWFFDQWVWRPGIPEIRWTYRATPAADGKYLVDLSLTQTPSADPKILLIPVSFRLDGDRIARKDWKVAKIEETLQIMLPGKPKSVLLDELGDLLARFDFDKSRL